jgi:hypothetical protein
MTDQERIAWLEADPSRLEDVRGRINNEGGTVREAIDYFAEPAPKTLLACEICKLDVHDPGQHYTVSKDRPDGFWRCHPHVGKVRCAKCEHVWRPKTTKLPDRCPSCSEDCDLFWADDGVWEQVARERSSRRDPEPYDL